MGGTGDWEALEIGKRWRFFGLYTEYFLAINACI
jgi:hypothetical protein